MHEKSDELIINSVDKVTEIGKAGIGLKSLCECDTIPLRQEVCVFQCVASATRFFMIRKTRRHVLWLFCI